MEQFQTYQERILELESQVTMQAKAIRSHVDAPNGKTSYSRPGLFPVVFCMLTVPSSCFQLVLGNWLDHAHLLCIQ